MPGIATARGRDGAAPKARLVAPAAIAAQGWRVGGLRRHDLRAIAAPSDFVHVGPAPGGTGGSVYCLCPATGGAILTDVPCRDLIGRRFAYAAQAEAARVVTR